MRTEAGPASEKSDNVKVQINDNIPNSYMDNTPIFYASVGRLTPTVLPAIHCPPQRLNSNSVRIWAWVRRLHGVASQIKLVGFNHIALYRRERVMLTNPFTTRRLWGKYMNTYALCKLKRKEKVYSLLRISTSLAITGTHPLNEMSLEAGKFRHKFKNLGNTLKMNQWRLSADAENNENVTKKQF